MVNMVSSVVNLLAVEKQNVSEEEDIMKGSVID